MDKVWKDITGYEGLYQVSSDGEIKNHKKIMKPADNGKGYKSILLCKNGRYKNFYVHRIVATEFVPNPDRKPVVNHKNGKRDDNGMKNLEWVTASENEKHKYSSLGFIQKKAIPVAGTKDGEEIGMFPSMKHAERATGCGCKEIKLCCIGKIRQTKGIKWKYITS